MGAVATGLVRRRAIVGARSVSGLSAIRLEWKLPPHSMLPLWNALQPHLNLLDLCLVDFFIERQDQRIPDEWIACFQSLGPQGRSRLAIGDHKHLSLPDSMRELVNNAIQLPLPRKPAFHPPIESQHRISQKKAHEVASLTHETLALSSPSSLVIDIGGGLGYTGHSLTKHQRNVISIEADPEKTKAAIERVSSLPSSSTDGSLTFVTAEIGLQTDRMTLSQIISSPVPPGTTLIGLHACGDLGASLAHLFAQGVADTLIVACCCFNLLSEPPSPLIAPYDQSRNRHRPPMGAPAAAITSAEIGLYGFPMSSAAKAIPIHLGRRLRNLAAVAPDRMKSLDAVQASFRGETWRAVLEVWLHQHGLAGRRVGRVMKKGTWPDYVRNALDKLGANNPSIDLTAARQAASDDHSLLALLNEHDVSVMEGVMALRFLVAPLIESLVLTDRLLYLQEQPGIQAHIKPIFDPAISPRCYALIAHRG